MTTISLTFDVAILYIVAANVIAILVYTLIIKNRRRRMDRSIATISKAIVDYFSRSGTTVDVGCISRIGGRQFIAFVNSEPLKRFRYSHIVEGGLRDHIQKEHGLELERVFWRFPVKMARAATEPEGISGKAIQSDNDGDAYINERLLRLKTQAEYEVTAASWEQFSEALRSEKAEILQATEDHR